MVLADKLQQVKLNDSYRCQIISCVPVARNLRAKSVRLPTSFRYWRTGCKASLYSLRTTLLLYCSYLHSMGVHARTLSLSRSIDSSNGDPHLSQAVTNAQIQPSQCGSLQFQDFPTPTFIESPLFHQPQNDQCLCRYSYQGLLGHKYTLEILLLGVWFGIFQAFFAQFCFNRHQYCGQRRNQGPQHDTKHSLGCLKDCQLQRVSPSRCCMGNMGYNQKE